MKKLLLTTATVGLVLSYTTHAKQDEFDSIRSKFTQQDSTNEAELKAEEQKSAKMAEAAQKKQDAMEKEVADIKTKIANVDSEEGMKKLAADVKKLTAKLERTQRGNEYIAKNFEEQRTEYLTPKTEAYRKGAKKVMRSAIKDLGELDGKLDLKGFLRDKKRSKKK